MVMADNFIVQRAWNMDMPNTVTPTEYTRTWKPAPSTPAWSAWVKVGGEPSLITLIVNAQQTFTGPISVIRPNLVEYKEAQWTSDNQALYTF